MPPLAMSKLANKNIPGLVVTVPDKYQNGPRFHLNVKTEFGSENKG